MVAASVIIASIATLPDEMRLPGEGILIRLTGFAVVAFAGFAVTGVGWAPLFFAASSARIFSCCSLVSGTGGRAGGESGPCAGTAKAPIRRIKIVAKIFAIKPTERSIW